VEDTIDQAVHGLAALDRAGNLRNEKASELKLGIALAELRERFCGLLGRHDAEVTEFAAPDGVRIVEGDDIVDEVSAIVADKLVGLFVLTRIEFGDEAIIILGRSGQLKTVEGAVECGANELIPILSVGMGGRRVGGNVRKMCAAILVAQIPGELGVDEKGN